MIYLPGLYIKDSYLAKDEEEKPIRRWRHDICEWTGGAISKLNYMNVKNRNEQRRFLDSIFESIDSSYMFLKCLVWLGILFEPLSFTVVFFSKLVFQLINFNFLI